MCCCMMNHIQVNHLGSKIQISRKDRGQLSLCSSYRRPESGDELGAGELLVGAGFATGFAAGTLAAVLALLPTGAASEDGFAAGSAAGALAAVLALLPPGTALEDGWFSGELSGVSTFFDDTSFLGAFEIVNECWLRTSASTLGEESTR